MNRITTILSLAALALAGCGKKNEFIAPPPPPVTVANPELRDVTVYRTFPGTLEGIAQVEIRARVRGVLEKRHFEDGNLAKEGAPLFLIEQEPYQASVSAAEGHLASAVAAHDLAKANRMRLEKAFLTKAVSEIEVLVSKAEEDQAAAAIKEAEAKLENAKIDYSYTEIKAPVDGRLSRALVDVGNLVGGTESTLLTTIVDDTSIRAYFEINERVILPYLSGRPREGQEQLEIGEDVKLQLELTNGNIYDHTGTFDFIDNKVDDKTRTIRVRAVFPNPDGKLAAGLFARIGIPFKVDKAVIIPTLAIQRDLAGDFVWVVDDGNVVRRRAVEAGPTLVEERIIEKGLEGSDRIIVAGLQRAREGGTVKPETAKPKPAGEEAKPDGKADAADPAETPDTAEQEK